MVVNCISLKVLLESESSQLPVIFHISQMKSIDKTRSSHEKFHLGAEIAYYDSSLGEWLGGVIKVSWIVRYRTLLCIHVLFTLYSYVTRTLINYVTVHILLYLMYRYMYAPL